MSREEIAASAIGTLRMSTAPRCTASSKKRGRHQETQKARKRHYGTPCKPLPFAKMALISSGAKCNFSLILSLLNSNALLVFLLWAVPPNKPKETKCVP